MILQDVKWIKCNKIDRTECKWEKMQQNLTKVTEQDVEVLANTAHTLTRLKGL